MDMPFKIRVFGSCSGVIVEMCGSFAGSAFKAVIVQFIVHVMHPLLLIYAGNAYLDILVSEFTY